MEIEQDELQLHRAARRGDIDAVRVILSDASCEVDAVDGASQDLALHIACENGFNSIVDLLLDRGASLQKCRSIEKNDGQGLVALNVAIMNGKTDTVKLLLKRGADVHRPADRRTPLHWACFYGHLEVAHELIKNEADVNAKTRYGCTALHLAAMSGSEDIVNLLLSRNADVFSLDTDGRSVVQNAWEFSHPEVAELLLRAGGAYTDAESHCAAREDLVKKLLNCNADVNASDGYGMTVLLWACRGKSLKVAECLLQSGASINAAVLSNDSWSQFARFTALHFAVQHCNWREEFQIQIDLVELLLQWGADVNATDSHQQTPLECYLGLPWHLDEDQAIGKLFVKHIEKMQYQNLYVSDHNIEVLSDDEQPFHDFSKACKAEIENMRERTIGDSSITFFDVFTKGPLQLAEYMNNESVTKILESRDFERVFPIYADHLGKKFEQGKERQNLLRKSNSVLRLGKFRFVPYECMKKVKSYLSNEDLRNIVKAKPQQP